ncbi:enoyl-CoA hydratase-related protein [Ramlibacter sp. XY19]|uniref:enoyl-CoA hydratase-related protein n=1 Tax=Ramlibacter paludis TaxID=2908000 RepID=UPI0023DC3473|nr:enoyl-CoA hydratase-related protein [Ramlibacter paludis]MCG2595280.1 enoyl-CoA hydratase-related protein [Ramlibacter paludis]
MQCFQLTVERQVAHLVLSRPDAMNTMHPQFWRELDEVLAQLHRDPGDARVLVLSSTGKHFSAGMALEAFGGAITMDDSTAEGRAAIFDLLTDMQSTFTRLETLRMPVIAAIQGGCVGGAVDLVTACCLRYATRDAFFCIQEINIGMVADVGTLQRLPKLLPMAVAKEMAYTGRRLPAARAAALGLVNEVFETPAEMMDAVMQCAGEIAAKPPVAIWGSKQALHYARDHSVDDALKQMGWLQGAIWSNAHVREAIMSGKEKRAATFPGLQALQSFREL